MSDGDNNTTGSGRTLGGGPAEPHPSRSSSSGSRNTSGLRSGPGRIATLGNMGQSSGGGRPQSRDDDSDDEDEDDDRKRETWFAGGEKSGISIENPDSKRSVPGGHMVRDLLRRAAEAGPPPAASAWGAFRGGGHKLGSDEVESQYVADPDADDEEEESAIRHLTFWRDGFQVEDGELMRYDDPQHEKTLAEINSGLAPPSILNVRTGQHVELRVSKRTQEDYVPPKGAKTFKGTGHRLGAVSQPHTDTAVGGTSMPGSFPPGSTTAPNPSSSSEGVRSSFSTKFEVDQTQPTTSIQIRLADGTRMVARMNLTHTVGDIRNFINATRAENQGRPYTIGTTFPNRTLDDDTATIQGAGLVNSVIVQRWV